MSTDLPSQITRRLTTDGDCWVWTGYVNDSGYGRIHWGGRKGRNWLVHRLVYTLLVGEIPEGLTLDHVKNRGCRFLTCVNPAHLEPVTSIANIQRGGYAAKTHCSNGHEYTAENTYIGTTKKGTPTRVCRDCRKLPERKARAAAEQRRRRAGRKVNR